MTVTSSQETAAAETMTATPTVAVTAAASGLPVMLIVAYVVAMPFLAGLPRGSLLPVLRPSEGLQLAVTGAGLGLVALAMINGRRWRFDVGRIEWWLLSMTTAASVVPVLWLVARQGQVGGGELLAALPFVKYTALYLLVRMCIRSETEALTAAKAFIASALIIAAMAVTQAMGVGPVVDVLGRFFVSSIEDVVDGGRGTTTIGSSIATGAYLAIATGTALSLGLASASRAMFFASAGLAAGTLATGQAGSVLALGVVIVVVAHLQRRSAQLLRWGLPIGALGLVALWPIVVARLADIDQGSGLPESWVIRGNNISELYLPTLFDGGWILGVSPDAVVQPPDVWRQTVYLESGYLWLLWVGGLPLLVAALGFLRSAWQSLRPAGDGESARNGPGPDRASVGSMSALGTAARAAVAMIVVLSVLDPHLTLRAGADAFFVVLALALASRPLAVPLVASPLRWRALLAADNSMADYGGARLQLAEAAKVEGSELTLRLNVRHDGRDQAGTQLALFRRGSKLDGAVVGPVRADSDEAGGLLWRAVAVIANSLRLDELRWTEDERPERSVTANRVELKAAAELAEKLEIERTANQHRYSRPSMTSNGSLGVGDDSLPAIRLDLGLQLPPWKRGVDLALGGMAAALTAPLWLTTALLVRRSSAGPVLYRQVRVGTGGLPFQIYKFRTMFIDNDDSAHREQNRLELRGEAEAAKDCDDPRITPIGRWLRRLSLDELPQLINIMRSEMSLVGPRPSLLWESELFQPPSRRRLKARPGLTGLWQISGRADVSMSEMLELDLAYVDRMGPMTDARCLAGTITSVLAGDGAR